MCVCSFDQFESSVIKNFVKLENKIIPKTPILKKTVVLKLQIINLCVLDDFRIDKISNIYT